MRRVQQGAHEHLCLWTVSLLSPDFPAIAPDLKMTLLHIYFRQFSNCCFLTGYWSKKTTVSPPKGESQFLIAHWDPLDINLISFPSQLFWVLDSPGQIPGSSHLLFWYRHPSGELCPYSVSSHQGSGLLQDCVSASPTHLSVILLTFGAESSSFRFQIFFRVKWSICSCWSGVSTGGSELQIFRQHHLGPPPP